MNLCVQDYGYPQSTATETLKSYIYNEPETVEKTMAPRKKSVSGSCGSSTYCSVSCGCSDMSNNLDPNSNLRVSVLQCTHGG